MILIYQTETTNIGIPGYTFPVGTKFTGFLTISEAGQKGEQSFLNTFYQWFVDDADTPTTGLNLPTNTSIIVDPTIEAQYNEALLINTQLNVNYVEQKFPNLEGEIEIQI